MSETRPRTILASLRPFIPGQGQSSRCFRRGGGIRHSFARRKRDERQRLGRWSKSSSIAAPETVISLNPEDGSAMTAGCRSCASSSPASEGFRIGAGSLRARGCPIMGFCVRRRAGVMIQEPLSMAPDLIFNEVRGAIEAGIGFLRLGVRLQRRAGTQMQGAIRPKSRTLRFNRDMASDQPGPVFRERGINSRFDMRAKSQANVQILARDTQSHCLLSTAGGARRCAGADVPAHCFPNGQEERPSCRLRTIALALSQREDRDENSRNIP